MEFLRSVKLIQGGMGAYVSNWRLARAVAAERPGELAGTVSGTALDVIYVRLLQLGDPGGHVRRALEEFDSRYVTDIGQKISQRYYIEGGKSPHDYFKNAPMQIPHALDGKTTVAAATGSPTPIPLKLDDSIAELLIATGFAEVWLAKQGHDGKIFINFLNKIELPLVHAMYGAMLAGVDGIIVGAGNPEGLPAICSSLANHDQIVRSVPVLYAGAGQEFTLVFDPKRVAGGALAHAPLVRPAFLAIASLEELVRALAASSREAPDGFIVEHHTAGGHNASPVGPLKKDDMGQPIYDARDEPDLAVIRQVGRPFWLAGGYGSRAGLQKALAAGAEGVQVGTVFALCEESGMKPEFRSAILQALRSGIDEAELVQTTMFSPTGFPFKVVQLAGTLSDEDVYAARNRTCDLGLLQQLGLSKPDEGGMSKTRLPPVHHMSVLYCVPLKTSSLQLWQAAILNFRLQFAMVAVNDCLHSTVALNYTYIHDDCELRSHSPVEHYACQASNWLDSVTLGQKTGVRVVKIQYCGQFCSTQTLNLPKMRAEHCQKMNLATFNSQIENCCWREGVSVFWFSPG